MSGEAIIRELDALSATEHKGRLAEVLRDCVDGGASVSFMWPFDLGQSCRYWDKVLSALSENKVRLFGAFRDDILVGTVQLWFDVPDNQPHRGDIRKLLVHRSARRLGLARRLMEAAESEAKQAGLSLLVLDTVTDSPAQSLYEGLGWVRLGVVPRYALWPDGRFCDATFLYKELGAAQ